MVLTSSDMFRSLIQYRSEGVLVEWFFLRPGPLEHAQPGDRVQRLIGPGQFDHEKRDKGHSKIRLSSGISLYPTVDSLYNTGASVLVRQCGGAGQDCEKPVVVKGLRRLGGCEVSKDGKGRRGRATRKNLPGGGKMMISIVLSVVVGKRSVIFAIGRSGLL